jgi:hypothetical protein
MITAYAITNRYEPKLLPGSMSYDINHIPSTNEKFLFGQITVYLFRIAPVTFRGNLVLTNNSLPKKL